MEGEIAWIQKKLLGGCGYATERSDRSVLYGRITNLKAIRTGRALGPALQRRPMSYPSGADVSSLHVVVVPDLLWRSVSNQYELR